MCGIAGIFQFNDQPVERNEIKLILDKMTHRGRNKDNIILETNIASIALGHRRLSIIDLNDHAQQPMYYADKQLCLTYNGEVYNYKQLRNFLKTKSYTFTTQSDSEVILAAYDYWGKSCVNFFNGMFAFALWDKRTKELFCARDHIGIKPFYYFISSQYFAFASEAFALNHVVQKRLNPNAILSYLLSLYVGTTESIFKSIYKLKPGHTLQVKANGQYIIKPYWKIAQFESIIDEEAGLENLTQHLKQAITRQIQSDVPVGGFLSGGIDSGLITAIAAPLIKTFYTYSVGYEGMDNNELPFAKALAKKYGTIHKSLIITAQDVMPYLNKALLHCSEPIADSALVATYRLAKLAAQDGVKVLLNGTGGDEIFAGYTRYTGQLSYKRKAFLNLPPVLKRLLCFLPLSTKNKYRLKHTELDMLFAAGGSYHLSASMLTKQVFTEFLNQFSQEINLALNVSIPFLYQRMLFDLHHYLPNQLLFLLDQMTMAHTVEGRVPLIDLEIVKAAYHFKAIAHVQNGQTKALLKKIALPFLGEEYITRKKQGFAACTGWWVKNNYNEFLETIATLRQHSFFESLRMCYPKKAALLTQQEANDIYLLFCFAKWHERLKRT